MEYEIEGADAIDEGADSYTVRLRRKGNLIPGATVPYTVSGTGSSAASAADFAGNVFPTGSFTFNGYDALSDYVTFTIEDDSDSEGDETFQINVDDAPNHINPDAPTPTAPKVVYDHRQRCCDWV